MRKYLLAIVACLALSSVSQAQSTVDIGIADVGPVNYLTPGTHEFWIGGKVVTGGFTNLNAITVGWSFDGGPWQTYSATTPVFAPQGTRFPLNMPVKPTITVTTPGQYVLKTYIKSSTINDPNIANDTLVRIVRVHNTLPPKNVLFEVFKFQHCQPCYRGDTAVNGQIKPKPYMNVARLYISAQAGELFYNKSADTVDEALVPLGHPSYGYDRFRWPYQSTPLVGLAWQSGSTTYIEDSGHRVRFLEPLSMSFEEVKFDSITRQLTVKLKASVFDTLWGDHRFNMYVTEDSIYAMQSGAPGSMYWHTSIMREALGHAWGTANSMPAILLPGQSYSHTYTITLPANYKKEKLRLIGFVQHYDAQDEFNRRVLNSVGGNMLTLAKTTGINTIKIAESLNLYPNPAKDYLTFDWGKNAGLQLQMFDITGKLLREWYDEGREIKVWLNDVPAGSYILEATDGTIMKKQQFQKVD